MMNNFMIDIETLGTTPGSVVMSLAAIQFDLNTGAQGKEFYATIDKASSIAVGLRVEAATERWWKDQNKAAYNKMFVNNRPLVTVLVDFARWMNEVCPGAKLVWGNSARFDMGLLEACYKAVNLPTPWAFYNERCCRTIVALDPSVKEGFKAPSGAHDPLIDCEFQIRYVVATIQAVKAATIKGYREELWTRIPKDGRMFQREELKKYI